MLDKEEGGTRRKEGRGGRRNEVEGGTGRKEGRGGKRDEEGRGGRIDEDERATKKVFKKKEKWLEDPSLTHAVLFTFYNLPVFDCKNVS